LIIFSAGFSKLIDLRLSNISKDSIMVCVKQVNQ
jgi:hypothetical protein